VLPNSHWTAGALMHVSGVRNRHQRHVLGNVPPLSHVCFQHFKEHRPPLHHIFISELMFVMFT
jgi:hypothetical protein